MQFQSLKISIPESSPFQAEIRALYQQHATDIVRAALNLALNTAVAGSVDEATEMINAGVDSVVVFGEDCVWQGVDGIVEASFADLDISIPTSEESAAFIQAVTPGMIKDVIAIISGAFEAMDELSEGLG